MCYDPILHNLAFIEGDTTTRCTNATTCNNITYMKREDKGTAVPNSSANALIGDFVEITVCTARDDLNSTSCSQSCTPPTTRSVSCTKCSECTDRVSCRALNVISNRSRDQEFVGELSVQINDETDLCTWYGTDDTGYCGPYGLTGSCNVIQTDKFCRGALYDGSEWCDLDEDGTNYHMQADVAPDANGAICNSAASHTIQDVLGMVKCKSAYSRERIPTFGEYTNYDAKNFFNYMNRPVNQAPLFDSDGYPTNTEEMCKKCNSCSERLSYECGTREFFCCLCQSPIATGEWCCDTDEFKHIGSKQCGGNGKCYKNAPVSDRTKQVSFAEKYAPDGNTANHILGPVEEIREKLQTGEYDPVDYPFLSNLTNFEKFRRTIYIFSMFESQIPHMDGYTFCWSDARTSISCPTSPRNYSCEYELYNDLIQKNGEACWSFSGGNCAADKYTQEGGIRNGKSQFETLGYMSEYWYVV